MVRIFLLHWPWAGSAQPYDTLYPIPQAIIVQGEGVISQNAGYGN
jgi:hypothetical protein